MMLSVILQAAEPAHESAKKFSELDPVGVGMTVIAMSVVFLSLILLYLTFKNVARLYSIDLKKRWLEKKGKPVEDVALPSDTTGELGAAIGLALHLYRSELHDHENTLLTIKKVTRVYSPWSSKIYGLRKTPK